MAVATLDQCSEEGLMKLWTEWGKGAWQTRIYEKREGDRRHNMVVVDGDIIKEEREDDRNKTINHITKVCSILN